MTICAPLILFIKLENYDLNNYNISFKHEQDYFLF